MFLGSVKDWGSKDLIRNDDVWKDTSVYVINESVATCKEKMGTAHE